LQLKSTDEYLEFVKRYNESKEKDVLPKLLKELDISLEGRFCSLKLELQVIKEFWVDGSLCRCETYDSGTKKKR
jgi:hypothetical protein